MKNAQDLMPGNLCETMMSGFIVPVQIVSRETTVDGPADCDVVYGVKYLGERKCLDIGANIFVNPGDLAWTRPMNIRRAAEWRSKGY